MNNDGSGPKISLVSKIIMLMLVISADLFDLAIAGTVSGAGAIFAILSWIYGLAVSCVLTFWLFMIGVKITWAVPGFLFETIPGLNILPARTLALLITFAKDEAETIIKVSPVINKMKVAKKSAAFIKRT